MNNSNSTVDVVLYLRGHSLDPTMVTSMLGTSGSKTRVKGEKWQTSTNQEVTAKIGLWTLDAKADSSSLSDQISWLKNKLSLAKCSPLNIQGVEQVEINVFIALGSDDEGDGDYSSQLTAEDLTWLSSFGASLSFKLTHSKPRILGY
ncbi:MAG: DUF4279 domain-containing protein [Pseudomonadota bacterium]